MERKLYTKDERITLLQKQATEKVADEAFAKELGISIWTLRGWKRGLNTKQKSKGFIEIPAQKVGAHIRIHLPGNILMEVPFSGNYGSLASLVREFMA